MLLRAAGIPTRYMVGYAIDEYSTLEGMYISRSRDAHSWVLAYINGVWRMVDTTPAIWAPIKGENASPFESVFDFFAWMRYKIALFQTEDELEQENSNNYMLYLLVPLIGLLAWRLYFKQRIRLNKIKDRPYTSRHFQGMDSQFFALVSKIEKAGYLRRKGETLARWLERINLPSDSGELIKALSLHYRLRFDPNGASKKTRDKLSSLVDSLLESCLTDIKSLK